MLKSQEEYIHSAMPISLDHIRQFLQTFRRQEYEIRTLVPAGVLVPLFEHNGGLNVILTQRTDDVEHHKGQISFPGGLKEENDATIIETALREAEEEIGLSRKSVEILGVLNDFQTPSGFHITPVVAFLPFVPSFFLNTAEVFQIFDVPLSFFLDTRNERVERHEYSGKVRNVYFYQYGQFEIWGATAAMLRSFLHDVRISRTCKKTL
jgi:8-oxo-dGTP pyrophosphatase MutT (NUDIX family)